MTMAAENYYMTIFIPWWVKPLSTIAAHSPQWLRVRLVAVLYHRWYRHIGGKDSLAGAPVPAVDPSRSIPNKATP